MEGEASVSVIIPTFGRHASLSRAVSSAAAQLSPTDEVIVVDDGSAPPIGMADLPETSTPVRLIRSDANLGPAGARNLGIAEARGRLIAFLDSDDEWLPGKLDGQRALLDRVPGDLVAVSCGWQDVSAGRVVRVRRPVPSATGSDFFAGCWFCPGSTLLVAKRAFERVGPFAPGIRRLEDLEWFIRFGKAGGRLVVADVIGAAIARGGNARPGPVESAADAILARLDGLPDLTRSERADLAAYLDLERAAAYANVGRWPAVAASLGRSFLRRPRAGLPLRRWWRP